MIVNKDIIKFLNLFMQAWTGGVFRIIHCSSSPTVPCIICNLLTETSFLAVFCCIDLGKTMLEVFLKHIIVHSNNLVLLLTRCYVLHIKVDWDTSVPSTFSSLVLKCREGPFYMISFIWGLQWDCVVLDHWLRKVKRDTVEKKLLPVLHKKPEAHVAEKCILKCTGNSVVQFHGIK